MPAHAAPLRVPRLLRRRPQVCFRPLASTFTLRSVQRRARCRRSRLPQRSRPWVRLSRYRLGPIVNCRCRPNRNAQLGPEPCAYAHAQRRCAVPCRAVSRQQPHYDCPQRRAPPRPRPRPLRPRPRPPAHRPQASGPFAAVHAHTHQATSAHPGTERHPIRSAHQQPVRRCVAIPPMCALGARLTRTPASADARSDRPPEQRPKQCSHHRAAHGPAHGRAHLPVLARAHVLVLLGQQPLRWLRGGLHAVERAVPADGLAHGGADRAAHGPAQRRTNRCPDVPV